MNEILGSALGDPCHRQLVLVTKDTKTSSLIVRSSPKQNYFVGNVTSGGTIGNLYLCESQMGFLLDDAKRSMAKLFLMNPTRGNFLTFVESSDSYLVAINKRDDPWKIPSSVFVRIIQRRSSLLSSSDDGMRLSDLLRIYFRLKYTKEQYDDLCRNYMAFMINLQNCY